MGFYHTQLHEMSQSFDEPTEGNRTVRDNLEELFTLVDQDTGAAENVVEIPLWVISIPFVKLVKRIFVELPGLPWRDGHDDGAVRDICEGYSA
jgi:hypothetical protein